MTNTPKLSIGLRRSCIVMLQLLLLLIKTHLQTFYTW